MDKGKSKTDLRAAGKKRLEEYRQKRQQKGSSTKPSSTAALKALTESDQNVGEHAVEEISGRASLRKAQRSSSQKDGAVESVVDHVHGDVLEERREVDVVFDTSPGSSVTSSIQRLEVGGGHLTPETSEQSVESLHEPGSSNGNLDDEDREAVYTILWEDHGTEHSQCNEEWQESTLDGGSSLNERGFHQGNCSSRWVDNESYRSESKEGPSTQRKLSGNPIGATDKFQSSQDSEVDPTLSNLFSESELGEKLQSVQGMLQARDMELIDVMTKLEGATRVISEQEEEAKAYVQQNERLKEELIKCYEDLGMLKSNVNMAEQKMIGLKNELHEVIDSFNSIPEECSSRTEGETLSMNEMLTELNSLAKAIVEQAHKREMEMQSANGAAMTALSLESNKSKELLAKFERDFRDSRNAAQDISWLYGASPPQSSLLDWATWLIDTLQNEHRKSEQHFQVTESMTMTANANTLKMQHLQEKIDSLYVELSSQRNEKETVAEDLRRRDLELQIMRDKLQEQVENNLVLDSEVEEAKNNYSSVYDELLSQKNEIENLRSQQSAVREMFGAERDSLKAEIQVLKDSSLEISRRENEFSEALKAVTTLQAALTLKDRELSQLHAEMSDLSLRSAQQDSSIESLMEERERLSSEQGEAQRLLQEKIDSLHIELSNQRNEKEVVAEDLRRRDLELQIVRDKLQEQVENNLVLDSEVEEAKNNYSSVYDELLSQKNENENLRSQQSAVREMFGAERDSLKAEIQVLKDSSLETSRRENEFSEALKAVTNLQAALTLKDRELSQLHAEMSLRSAQQDSSIESLMEERERLSFEKVEAQRLLREKTDSLHVELSNQQNEKEVVAEDLRRRDLELQIVRNKLQEQVENNLGLESEIEDAKNNYSSLYDELLNQKNENENLQSQQRAVHEMFGAERDSLKAEIQVLKDSSLEISRRENEFSEALKAVTNLQEALTLKDRELSQLHAEMSDLSLRSAQQDSSIESLMEERERLSSEQGEAQRLLQEKINSLHVELSNQRNEKEVVAEDLRRRDLELQIVRDKLQDQVENNLVLESEVESARSMSRVESALMGIENIVGDFHFQGRPPSTSTPSEWISWLIQIFREVSEELKTSESASDVLALQVEEAKNNYSSVYDELLSQKNENENLQSQQRAVREMFGAERDSLKAEIQVLKDSSLETSRRENELSEALNAVTNLQEALILKDRELSQVHAEMSDLSLRSAQQDSNIQSLMEERERLSSEVVDVNDVCNLLQVEMSQTANEKNNLHSVVNQLEQKLGAVREKLNLAINKGKGLVKQRDSLKMSLAEETAKVETMVLSHAKDIQSKDSELLEMRGQAESMGTRVQELQAEVSSLFEKTAAYQQSLETERRGLESVFFGLEVSEDLLTRDPIEKVKWLVSLLEGARSSTKFLEGELGSSRNALETLKAVLRDTEERLQSVTAESLRAQEDISMYAKKVEEVESRATFDRTQYKNEVDDLTRALKEADLGQQAAWSRVKEFEKTLEKQQNAINASEVAHSKAVSKLTFTRNKLNLLVQDSQELVRECESLHKSLQERDIEIVELNHEVDRLKNVIHIEQSQRMDTSSNTSLQLTLLQEELARTNERFAATVKDLREQQVALQCLLKEKDSELEGVRTKIEDILIKGDNVLWMEHNIVHQNKGDDAVAGSDVQSMNGSLDFTSTFINLEERFNNLVAEAQLHRDNSDKKEAQIQKLKKELHDISIERTTLQAGVQAKTMEVERLQSEVNSKGVSVECTISAESEIEELGTKSTWAGTGNSVTPHVRGPRRHSQADIAIDMVDANNSNLLSDMNDKEHGFSALTNSRLVPKAARILADRLDGFWFVGGRILTKQPSARLGLAIYWIFIHVYMAMIFSRGIL